MFTITASVKTAASFSTLVKSTMIILAGLMTAFVIVVPVTTISVSELLVLATYPVAVTTIVALMINRSYFTNTDALKVSRLIALWSVAAAAAAVLFYGSIGI